MNRTHRSFLFVVPVVMGILVVGAWALPSRITTGIPDADKHIVNPPLPEEAQKRIAAFLATKLTELAAEKPDPNKPDPVGAARDAMVRELRDAGDKESSPAWVDEYARQLNAALVVKGGVLDKGPIRSQLNAAIVVARIAQAAPTQRLEPVVLKLMGRGGQPMPASLVLWGLKAAAPMIQADLKGVGKSKLLGEVVLAVQAHPSGPVAAEGYNALIIRDPALKQAVSTQVIPELLKLFEARANVFMTGMLDDPEVDSAVAFNYLHTLTVWNGMLVVQKPRDDKSQLMQTVANFLSLASQRASKATPEQLEQTARAVAHVATCLNVIGTNMQDENMKAAVMLAKQLKPTSGAAQVEAAIPPMIQAIKGMKGVAVKDPPQASPLAGSGPATP